MFDATEQCDQVAFIVSGKVSALDTPHNLIMSRGAAKIRYSYFENGEKTGECTLTQTAYDKRLNELIRSNSLRSVHSSEPTLNDIFVDIKMCIRDRSLCRFNSFCFRFCICLCTAGNQKHPRADSCIYPHHSSFQDVYKRQALMGPCSPLAARPLLPIGIRAFPRVR